MKLVRKSDINTISNSPAAVMQEYLHGDNDINLAIGLISGKYPETGFVVNQISKELIYVSEGEISLILKDSTVKLLPGDSVIIEKNEKFAWDGQGKIITICIPAWQPDQHIEVEG